MKQFRCGDVVPGCATVMRARDEEGILSLAREHAARDHGMTTLPADVVDAVRRHIVAA